MLFDDRLATVLRDPAPSETAARTQFRQLLDLLGTMPAGHAGPTVEAGYVRLAELARELPAAVQSAILRGPGLRLRSPALAAFLAEREPQAAAAAMAMAELPDAEWQRLIPRLPLTARGFLRHRRDLPPGARRVLERLGVRDLVLPEPAGHAVAQPREAASAEAEAEAGIGALVRRIEAFQRARREGAATPRLPLGDTREPDGGPPYRAFDFATDAEGTITWADPAMAPLFVGLTLGPDRPGAVAALDPAGVEALAHRQPLRGARVVLDGLPEIAGEWRIDAAPAFARSGGHFTGHYGRMRRPPAAKPAATPPAPRETDVLRQMLHELRTPVSAIQGFAELIQQQLFGPAPNEYRALAAAIAVDAARLLAGFDEIDRLARLEAGILELDEGEADLRETAGQILRRLEGVLRQRSARIDFVASGSPFVVPLAKPDTQRLVWRLLATLAGALAPGEIAVVALTGDGDTVVLEADLPAALMQGEDPFAAGAPEQPRAISAGMFGTGFTLRLARAEAARTGGSLDRDGDRLRLVLPGLTRPDAPHTVDREGGNGAAA